MNESEQENKVTSRVKPDPLIKRVTLLMVSYLFILLIVGVADKKTAILMEQYLPIYAIFVFVYVFTEIVTTPIFRWVGQKLLEKPASKRSDVGRRD